MKNAKELMLEFTAYSIRDQRKAAEMSAEDGAFEMPYLASLGIPSRYKSHDAIADFFQFVRDLFPDLQFENMKVLVDTPDQAFGEYQFTTVSSKTGRSVRQLIFGRWSPRMERSMC